MAGELTKWMGGELVKAPSSALQRSRAAREAAEAVLRPQEQTVRATWDCSNCGRPEMAGSKFCKSCGAPVVRALPRSVAAPPYPGLLVDLPRKCAVHGKPYAARYVRGKDGVFSLGSMIDVTGPLYVRQYAGNHNTVIVPGSNLEDETCPLCGASGRGSVLCNACKSEVCYGRTAGNYFRCHPSCPGEGVLGPLPRVHYGVTPVDMRLR